MLTRFNLLLMIGLIWNVPISINGQEKLPLRVGIELDILPYATGGYFAAICAGKKHWRIRALTAEVHKPDWSTKKGFNNHEITAYAMVFDYFPASEWRRWWIGAGPVLWKSRIRADGFDQSTPFTNILLNGSLGYNIGIGKYIYLSPWMGMSLKIAGDKNIIIQNRIYNLPLLNPEVSLKLGAHF